MAGLGGHPRDRHPDEGHLAAEEPARDGYVSSPQVQQGAFTVTASRPLPQPIDPIEIALAAEALRRVEDAGGRSLREERERQGFADWQVGVSPASFQGSRLVNVQYFISRPGAATVSFLFRYDPATGAVTGP